jgi:peptide/nickel transport system substrate-binding protein
VAKRGGTFNSTVLTDPQNFEVAVQNSTASVPLTLAYNTLTAFAMSSLKDPTSDVVPELAESWELSPGGSELVLKIRQGVKWHNKTPVNGRILDVEDIMASLDRASKVGIQRAEFFTSASPSAPISSYSTPDSRTLVLKLRQPVYYILAMLAASLGGSIAILPKEADKGFDVRRDVIGTGAYSLTDYKPSIGMSFKRNPDFYDKSVGFLDSMEYRIVPEYATSLAQFKAGAVHTVPVRPTDVLTVKNEAPQSAVYKSEIAVGANLPVQSLCFGWQGKSPFLDERVRQAVSMSIDRDLWLDAAYNVSSFNSQGLPVETRWSSSVWADRDGWLDPKAKSFGENGKYYLHDIAEAKKLLSAAGYPSGLDIPSNISANGYGGDYLKWTETLEGMLSEAGIKTRRNVVDHASEFIPKYRDVSGKFEGIAMRAGIGSLIDAVMRIRGEYHSKAGVGFLGFASNGANDGSGDPTIDSLVDKAVIEMDKTKRTAIGYDMQRYLGKTMYDVKFPGGASGFALAWPALQNFSVFRGVPFYVRPQMYYYWLDETKPPAKSA